MLRVLAPRTKLYIDTPGDYQGGRKVDVNMQGKSSLSSWIEGENALCSETFRLLVSN